MYHYNLIIKRGDLDQQATDAMVQRKLTQHFGMNDGWAYITFATLDNEVVVIVRSESKRNLQTVLGQWFVECDRDAPFPVGTLLHYRELVPGDLPLTQLGG